MNGLEVVGLISLVICAFIFSLIRTEYFLGDIYKEVKDLKSRVHFHINDEDNHIKMWNYNQLTARVEKLEQALEAARNVNPNP